MQRTMSLRIHEAKFFRTITEHSSRSTHGFAGGAAGKGVARAPSPRAQTVVNFLTPAVSVAQPVEHRSVEPRVVGSNPIAHPNSFLGVRGDFEFRSLPTLLPIACCDFAPNFL